MKETLRTVWRRLTDGDRRVRIWLWLGVAGILLIGVSELIPHRAETADPPAITATADEVERALERRIAELLSAVEGVGECRVLVTLEGDARAVYAATETTDGQSYAEEVLVVSTDDGPAGLLLTTLQPSVKGVAVVCRGGGDPAVQQRVSDLVSTVFHISARRVCVAAQQ